jgi:hypothetical protein
LFSLLFILDGGRSLPVDLKRNIEGHIADSINNHNEKFSYLNLLRMIIKAMNMKVNSSYMNQIRVKILRFSPKLKCFTMLYNALLCFTMLYNAFKSYTVDHDCHHPHEIPLLCIVTTEPHSITVKIQPRRLEPDSMV